MESWKGATSASSCAVLALAVQQTMEAMESWKGATSASSCAVLALHNDTYEDGRTGLPRHHLQTSGPTLGRLSTTLSSAPVLPLWRIECAGARLHRHVKPPRRTEVV
jgi:hypothetical protein